MKRDVNNFLTTNLMNELTKIKRPYIPAHLKILLKSKTWRKNMYWEMNKQNLNINYQQKWNLDLDILIDNLSWKEIYKFVLNLSMTTTLFGFNIKYCNGFFAQNNNCIK